jgi:hypothetical protein
MFLRASTRKKDGKVHRDFRIVENRRLPGGRVSQRHVLYLGEINSSQERAWRKSVEVFDERSAQSRSLALFPEDRIDEGVVDESVVRLCLSQLRLCRPRAAAWTLSPDCSDARTAADRLCQVRRAFVCERRGRLNAQTRKPVSISRTPDPHPTSVV